MFLSFHKRLGGRRAFLLFVSREFNFLSILIFAESAFFVQLIILLHNELENHIILYFFEFNNSYYPLDQFFFEYNYFYFYHYYTCILITILIYNSSSFWEEEVCYHSNFLFIVTTNF